MFNLGKPSSTGSLFGMNQNNQANNAGTNMGNAGFSFGQNNNNAAAPGGATAGTGGLFANKPLGSTTATNPIGGGGLFGNNNTTAPGAAGGMFGTANNNTAAPGATSGMFGTKAAGVQPTTGGLFGSNNINPTTTGGGLFGNNNIAAAAPGAAGGLFGAKPAGMQTTGGGLFGNTNQSNTTTGGGLFGAKPATTTGGLFGSNTTTSGGLFGAKPAAAPTAGGLFGNNNAAAATTTGSGLFGNNNNASTLGGGLFGTQQQLQQQQQMSALQQISQLPVNPMTRISDLPPQLKLEIEQLDQHIQRQVQISQNLKSEDSEHVELIDSVPRDIQYLLKTQSQTNQLLAQDLKKILSIKDLTDQDIADSQTFSILLQQLLTPGSKVSSLELDKFFQHRIQVYHSKLDEYSRVLVDIENTINGINNEVTGSSDPTSINGNNGVKNSMEFNDFVSLKSGLHTIINTVIEEFNLFMDIAQRIAVLHQDVKDISTTY